MEHSRKTEFFATFFYLGRAPFMPGTVGTLGAIPLVLIFKLFDNYVYMGLSFILALWAIRVADQYEAVVQDHDSKEVVIDEVVGYVIAMFWLPATWQAYVYGFLIFRFFDILKPWPIGAIDRKAKGGFGTVVDDIVAGVLTNLALQFVYTETDWLGVQYIPGV